MSEQSIFTRVLFCLSGHSFEGLRLKQIAEGAGESSGTTLRNLQRMEEDGLVERIPGRDDCWRLSPRIIQLAVAHTDEMRRLQQRIDEFNQRYTRHPN